LHDKHHLNVQDFCQSNVLIRITEQSYWRRRHQFKT